MRFCIIFTSVRCRVERGRCSSQRVQMQIEEENQYTEVVPDSTCMRLVSIFTFFRSKFLAPRGVFKCADVG